MSRCHPHRQCDATNAVAAVARDVSGASRAAVGATGHASATRARKN
jgi:hypothetical protein